MEPEGQCVRSHQKEEIVYLGSRWKEERIVESNREKESVEKLETTHGFEGDVNVDV